MIVSSASPRVADRLGVLALLGGERRVEQQAGHPDHRVHRRADLVAHRREERALRLVGRLGGRARLLGLVEQPHVLDRDHRLVGEGLHERDLDRRERAHLVAQQRDRTHCLALAQQRHREHRTESVPRLNLADVRILGIDEREDVLDMDKAALQHRASADRRPG